MLNDSSGTGLGTKQYPSLLRQVILLKTGIISIVMSNFVYHLKVTII